MEIVRYLAQDATEPRVGVRRPEAGLLRLPVATLGALWARPLDDVRRLVESADEPEPSPYRLLAPVDSWTEVWAAGVTYTRSREARMEESETADVYDRVYAAERPELFFKAPAWRVAGPGEPVGVRTDSSIDVPEPEMALVLTTSGEVAGVTVCDDVSSRSIEGENPLYLPQAKIYAGACALGPVVRPAWELADVHDLALSVEVCRGREVVWAAETSTAALHRRADELTEYLFRGQNHPCGAVLSTGTGLVPALDFSLATGDEVRITLEGVGTLANPVVRGRSGLDRTPWAGPEGGESGAA